MARNSDITEGLIAPSSYQQTAQMAPAGLRKQYQQAKYDPRMTALSPLVKGLSRGFIAQSADVTPFDSLGLRRFSFLFNPSEIDVAYTSAINLVANNSPGTTSAGSTLPALGVPAMATVALSLLVDRTYDTWANQQSRGVMEDILQLEKMCGYSELNPYLSLASFCHIFLGPVMHWFGVITDIDVTYTSWTQYLVPNRAAISLTFQVYVWDGSYAAAPLSAIVSGTTGSQNTANQQIPTAPTTSTQNQQTPKDPASKSQTAPAANPTGKKPVNKSPRGAS